MKTLRKVARIRRFRSLVVELPGRHGEDTVRITFEPYEGKHRPAEDESQPEQWSVWALRARQDADLWKSTEPRHLRDDREAAPEEVTA